MTPYSIYAQQAIGQWNIHQSYTRQDYITSDGTKLYALASGSLFSYNLEDQSIETYDKTSQLNDQGISYIRYNEMAKCLIIVYKNYNIDLLYDDGTVYNLTDYKDKTLSYDKTINRISCVGTQAYLCTNFGLVGINLTDAQFGDSYILNKKTYACAEYEGYLYATTESGLFRGAKTDNLLEISNWEQIQSGSYYNLILFDNTLFLCHAVNGLYRYNASNNTLNRIVMGNYHISDAMNGKMIITNQYTITIFDAADQWITIDQKTPFNHIFYQDNLYWGSNGDLGINTYRLDKEEKKLILDQNIARPEGPQRALAAYMTYDHGRLMVCGGGLYVNRFYNNGTIMQYKDKSWTSFQEKGIKDITGLDYLDISTIAFNPSDTSQAFASAGGEGVYEFKSGQFVQLYNQSNSLLRSVLSNSDRYVRVSGLIYDNDRNLWAMNIGVDSVVCIRKPDGTWTRPYYSDISRWSPDRTLLDSKGRMWISSMIHPGGLCCITLGKDIDRSDDDLVKARTSFINQDGNSLTDGEPRVFALAEDKEGGIWVGTISGPMLISNPDRWYNDDFHFTQVKIPRNDGTNLADFLLNGERINAIAVDGGNRKWFGTQNNGLYLIGADNITQLAHFTTENSPLPSNTIQSLCIIPSTGEVFIGTDVGIASYQSDATEAEADFSSDVHAYPNPVRSDYTGPIVIKGLVYDSDVKIVDAGGRLVHEGRSMGGMYTWDGCNQNGNRVASGVYMVLAADSEGKEGVVTKIVVIK